MAAGEIVILDQDDPYMYPHPTPPLIV
jgi:hypothetical protein